MNKKSMTAIAFMTILISLLYSSYCCAGDNTLFQSSWRICSDSSVGKEGVQNELGEWVISPIYDMVSYDNNVFWVFLGTEEPRYIGMIDPKTGFGIPAHYSEILIGDELIVAWDSITHIYDIFDRECRLIYTLPVVHDSVVYDYVTPNGANHVDVVQLDVNDVTTVHTERIPGFMNVSLPTDQSDPSNQLE